MPVTLVEVRKERSPEQVQAIIEAIYRAQIEALKLPTSDRQIRYVMHRPEHFHVPPGKSDNYTLVQVTLFAGRSIDVKRQLYRLIVSGLGGLGIGASDVFIVLHEVPLQNWGIRGGQPASEVDLGFQIDI
jgi:phenylpyruvate tautomerase PptA (4-oxalocrotonate tautomerase family)